MINYTLLYRDMNQEFMDSFMCIGYYLIADTDTNRRPEDLCFGEDMMILLRLRGMHPRGEKG